MSEIRKFDSGATRDTNKNKLDFEGFFSPEVLERRAQYMNKHRVQSDGNLRDSDNWQNLFGPDHFKVCIKSSSRHYQDMWKLHRGIPAFDEKGNVVNLEDAICALMFNCEAYLLKILKDKRGVSYKGFDVAYNSESDSGWYVINNNEGKHLQKDLKLHAGTGYCEFYNECGHEPNWGEAPGYFKNEAQAKKYIDGHILLKKLGLL